MIVTKCTDKYNCENVCKNYIFSPKIKFLIVAFSWDIKQLPWNVWEKMLLH